MSYRNFSNLLSTKISHSKGICLTGHAGKGPLPVERVDGKDEVSRTGNEQLCEGQVHQHPVEGGPQL